VPEDGIMQFHDAPVLSVPFFVEYRLCVDLPEVKTRFFQAARQTTRPAAVHPEDANDPGHSAGTHAASISTSWAMVITVARSRDRVNARG
jgi:hypothetical protein